jgi:uncharacterized protein involved in exopolysaccharide biosynthesis
MEGYQKLKRQLIPLLKGIPIIAAVFIVTLFLARKWVSYSPNMYQSIARIELDDEKYGFSGNSLYGNFDLFSTENKMDAEAAVLQSPLIVGQALDSLDFDLTLFRQGSLRNTLLYHDSPIVIAHDHMGVELYDREFQLDILDLNSFVLTFNGKEGATAIPGLFNEQVEVGNGYLIISKDTFQSEDKHVQLVGQYLFRKYSRAALIADVIGRLDAKAVDKDVAILRLVYKDGHPVKVAAFLAALCQSYVNDCVVTKSSAANMTVQFVQKELEEVLSNLEQAERDLESFKKQNNVINTRQETETGLKQLSDLQIQLVNLKMNKQAIVELKRNIDSGDYFEGVAVKFGFADLLMTELVKRLKLLMDERRDLLLKYTPDNEKVLALNLKIEEVKNYVKAAIAQNLKEIELKHADIEAVVELASHKFDDLPTREKKQHILERDFRLLEDVFNFLSHKKVEASIAANALLSFHRIIEPAAIPLSPVSPNGTLIMFVAGLLGLIGGVAIVYFRRFASARVTCREEIEQHSTLPVAGVIRSNNKGSDFEMLFKSLRAKGVIEKGQVICVASTVKTEGKSYVAYHLARAISKLGYSAYLIDANPQHSAFEDWESFPNSNGTFSRALKCDDENVLSESNIASMAREFDFTILDTAATAVDISGVEAMKFADLTLYVVRANHTCVNYLAQPDLLKSEYNIDNVQMILNDAHKASNYSGNYIGSRFSYDKRKKGIITWLKYIHKTYVKR